MRQTSISKAAGCSSEDKLYSMSCREVHDKNSRKAQLARLPVFVKQQEALASLAALMPNSQLPKQSMAART